MPLFIRTVSAVSSFLPPAEKSGDGSRELPERSVPGGSQSPRLLAGHCSAMALVLMVHYGGVHIPGSKGRKEESKGHMPQMPLKEDSWRLLCATSANFPLSRT